MADESSSIAAERGPDFLIIGAQRAGAAWLARALRRHPDVWMPPVDAIHYFDRSPAYPTPNRLAEPRPWRRLLSRSKIGKENRRELVRQFSRDFFRNGRENLSWDAKFFFGRYDDHWYASLFDERFERVVGESTTGYSMLNHKGVSQVHKLFPNLKALYILRDPVERSWSQLRSHYAKRIRRDELEIAEMLEFFDSETHRRASDYLGALECWGGCFPPEQFRVLFFDKLQASPDEFLAEVCEFLGIPVEPGLAPPGKINAAPERDAPPEIRRRLCEAHLDMTRKLARVCGGPADAWLERTYRVLDGLV